MKTCRVHFKFSPVLLLAGVEGSRETDVELQSLKRFSGFLGTLWHFARKLSSLSLMVLLTSYVLLSSSLEATELTLSCPQGKISFKVELAQTHEERAKGLMNRESLEEDEGMLFLFPEPVVASMWMKNTPLSLDMIFLDGTGKVLAIAENTTPNSLEPIGSVENTSQVLELKGGVIEKNRISKDCRVIVEK